MEEIIKVTNTKLIRLMIRSAANNLINNADRINDMNVFPVPDGDTGTNMSLTFGAAADSVDELPEDADIRTIKTTLAKASLRNARGNSGVILSQILRGLDRDDTEHDVAAIKRAFCASKDTAYRAVMKPAEGTILTVVREIAEFADAHFAEYEDIAEFLSACLAAGKESLARTPEILPVLKQAGVVDSGGCGLVTLLEGAVAAITSGAVTPLADGKSSGTPKKSAAKETVTGRIKYGYCTEFLINKESGRSAAQLRAAIETKGDCMLVIDDDDVVKVHIHTNHPGFVLEQALKLGELINIKIDNMRYQHNETIGNTTGKSADNIDAVTDANTDVDDTDAKKYGFAAVISGSGMTELYKSLGCDRIIPGGQTMNPSTQELIDAVSDINAECVYLLPNNKNIVLAAEQAAELCEKNIIVIPTTNMPQGITALAVFDEGADPAENAELMNEYSASVKCGQITRAARDSVTDGFDIKKDDFMAVSDGNIIACGADSAKVFGETADALIDDDTGVAAVYYGIDTDSAEAEEFTAALTKKYPDIDIKLNYGGQNVYNYIISAE